MKWACVSIRLSKSMLGINQRKVYCEVCYWKVKSTQGSRIIGKACANTMAFFWNHSQPPALMWLGVDDNGLDTSPKDRSIWGPARSWGGQASRRDCKTAGPQTNSTVKALELNLSYVFLIIKSTCIALEFIPLQERKVEQQSRKISMYKFYP
jgi:hypothetical protein